MAAGAFGWSVPSGKAVGAVSWTVPSGKAAGERNKFKLKLNLNADKFQKYKMKIRQQLSHLYLHYFYRNEYEMLGRL